MKGNIVIISGPSAVGKSRVIHEILNRNHDIKFIVSYTTRPPRKDEEDGRDYHFVSKDEFSHLIKTGQMLEWKETEFGFYGTPAISTKDYLLSGFTVLLDIDPQGFDSIKQLDVSSVYGVYLLPESLSVLYDQIVKRGAKRGIQSKQDADSRLHDSINSIKSANGYDMVMVNENVSITANNIIQWIKILNILSRSDELFFEWKKENGLINAKL